MKPGQPNTYNLCRFNYTVIAWADRCNDKYMD